MSEEDRDELAGAIWGTLSSPNELDSNLEAANVVDALCRLSRSIHHAGEHSSHREELSEIIGALIRPDTTIRGRPANMVDGLFSVAEAISQVSLSIDNIVDALTPNKRGGDE